MADEVRQHSKRMGDSVRDELKQGFREGASGVRELGGKVREVLGLAATIGGGVGLAEMVSHAIEAEDHVGRIAMKLRALGDAQEHIDSVMEQAKEASARFKITTDEALGSYERLLDKTGDPVFSEEALESVGLLSGAFHATAASATDVVAMFHKALGASTEQIKNEFGPALNGTLTRAGVTLDEFAPHAQELGAAMYRSGMTGMEGFKRMIGLLEVARDKGGDAESRLTGMRLVLDKLGTRQAVRMFGKESGIDITPLLHQRDALERLRAMMKSETGVKALEQVFTRGGAKSFFEGLLEPMQHAHDKFLVEHGIVGDMHANAQLSKAADAVGIKAFDEALKQAATSTSDSSKLQHESDIRAQETSRKLQLAFNRMTAAFENEKFLGAISRLADSLPAMADMFSKMVEFGVENPLSAAGVITAATFVKGALPGVGRAALGAAGSTILGGGVGVTEAMTASASATGRLMGAAMNATLVAGAAVLGAEIGKHIYDTVVDPAQHKAVVAGADASLAATDAGMALGSKSLDKKKRALAAIKSARAGVKAGEGGFADMLDTAISYVSSAPSPAEARAKSLKELAEAEAKLTEQIKDLTAAKERETLATVDNTRAQKSATRGVKPPAPAEPGAAPPGGG